MRLINADALHTGIALYAAENAYINDTALDVLEMVSKWLNEARTIDAEPVRHGRWVDRYGNKYDNHLYECSECKGKARYRFVRDELGKEIAEQALDDYCPHCGAKMDGNT